MEGTVIFQNGRTDFSLTPSIVQPPTSSHPSSHISEQADIRAKITAMIQNSRLTPHPSPLLLDNRRPETIINQAPIKMRFQSTGIFGQCCSRRCSSNRSEILPTQRPGPSRTRSLMPQSPMPCLPSRILFRSDAGDPIEAVLDAPPEQAAHTDGAGS